MSSQTNNKRAPMRILSRVDKWARSEPNRIAIVFENEEISYKELYQRSLKLAIRLKEHGVGLGDIVPYCLPKSVHAIVSMLAILRCGAAFTAMLPDSPASRKNDIVRACRPKLILCGVPQANLIEGLCLNHIVVSHEIDGVLGDMEGNRAEDDFPIPTNNHAACIMFTSGSTGESKGVVWEHGNIIVGMDSWGSYLGIGPNTRVLQWCSFTFDVSIAETIVALALGACICLPTDKERLEGIEEFIHTVGANWAFFTPSVARTLDPAQLPKLKTVVLGGEATSKEIVSRWAANRRLVNSYGPCEATIWFSFAELLNDEADVRNVGKPVPGSRGHIVSPDDPNLLLPEQAGAVGELLIEGQIVVRGYLNDVARSSAVFILTPTWYNSRDTEKMPDIFQSPDRPRFYLTGDLVQRCEDGSLRITGRKDRQVKIRGQKADLNEIKHHFLSNTTTIHDLVAHFEGFSTTQKHRRHELVAFFVARPGLARTGVPTIAAMTDELRTDLKYAYEALQKTIPAFMIPTLFIPMTQMPLNIHAKIDTSKLSSIFAGLDQSQERHFALYQSKFEPLRTADEIMLGQVVSHELRLEMADLNGNEGFIQLGGDSLKAMSVARKLRRKGKHLSTRGIMLSQTLKILASQITSLEDPSSKSRIPAPFSLVRPEASDSIQLQASEACGVTEGTVRDVFPCSALQEGLLGVSSRDSRANVARYVFRLGSTLDVSEITAAWKMTTSAIDTLRTRFFMSGSHGLFQAVIDASITVATYASLTDCLESDKLGAFNFGEPMARSSLVIDDFNRRYFVLTLHHAIIDIFTLHLIMQTFRAAYRREPLVSTLPFSVAIAERKDCTTVAADELFWKAALQHSPVPSWPRPSPICSLNVESEWASCSRRLEIPYPARRGGKTLSTYIEASWALLLSAYEGSDDIIFGIVTAGRESDGWDASEIAGPMLATCPLRMPVCYEATVGHFLQLTQQAVAKTIQHAHVGLQNIAKLGEDEKRGCSLQTLLVVQPEIDATECPDIDMELDTALSQEESLGSYACCVVCIPRGNQLELKMEYLPRAVGAGKAILEYLGHIICALIESQPSDVISSLTLFQFESSKVGHPRHETAMDVVEETVHEYILNIARRVPEKEAVIGWDGSFSYQELHRHSEGLALKLRTVGVDVGSFVPIYAQKSVWVVVGVLAVLRAGGTIVFLDINNPDSRHQEILTQIQPSVVLISPGNDRLWPNSVKDVVELSPAIEAMSTETGIEIALPFVPSDALAWCFFTSGTTGTPKGVQIEHKAWLTAAIARLGAFERCPNSRVLQISNFAFDLSIEDICGALVAGGTVAMPSEDERTNDLAGAINRYAVNHISVTPSVANLLDPEKIPSLEVLVVGGEVPSQALYNRWACSKNSKVHLLNAYGPTECSNWSTITRAISIPASADEEKEEEFQSEPRNTNIGHVTCGRIWVTHPDNPHLRMPLGTVGELLLEGPSLARGYHQNLHATSESFVANLRWAAPTRRFYRTGDLVRSNSDGSFSYLRRRDHQVKFRGIRLELAEIESKILFAGLEVLRDACVQAVVLEGRQTLIAFCKPADTISSQKGGKETWSSIVGAVAEKLSALLPRYMIPTVWVPLDALPTTITGKRDRSQLRRMVEQITTEQIRSYRVDSHPSKPKPNPLYDHGRLQGGIPPSPSLELFLTSMWVEVLGLSNEEVTFTSNFFNLGGDSVVAMRLVALCRERQIRLRVADIYKSPILRDLAELLTKQTMPKQATTSATSSLPAPFSMLGSWNQHSSVLGAVREQLPNLEIEDVYPCTNFQEGIMALSVQQPGSYVARHRFQLFSAPDIDLSRLWRVCEEVVAANPILRTRIIYIDGFGYFQVILCPEASNQSVVMKSGHEIRVRPWVPGSPLFQFEVLGQLESQIVCYASHAIFDAFSWNLILEQLNAACNSKLNPSMMAPFGSFVAHAQQMDDVKSNQFWSEQLKSAETTKLFATSQTKRLEKTLVFELALDSTDNSKSGGSTDATRLHAAWSIVLSQFSSSNDVAFGSVMSGRYLDIPEINKIMGPCIATVPLRLRLEREMNLHAWLVDLQQQLIDMIAHSQFGFTRISQINETACKFDSLITIFPTIGDTDYDVLKPFSSEAAYDDAHGNYSYPLVLEVQPSKSKLLVKAYFDSVVASPGLVKSLVNSFCYAYQQLNGADNQSTLGNINFCSPEDRRKIASWNSVELTTLGEHVPNVPDMVSSWGQLCPQKIAIEAWDGVLTYSEIEQYSSALAVYIHASSAISRTSEVIPICLARSRWVPVVMLAIQKMGMAYLALESSHPTHRLSQLIEQVQAKLVITDGDQARRFDIETLVVDFEFMERLPQATTGLTTCVQPEDPAVVVYTSGSTGVPKAILIQQRALANAIKGFGPRMDFGVETRTLQNAAFAFDIHVCEIFLTLAHGGCLIISDKDTSQLTKTIRAKDINWLFMTPSTIHLISGPEEIPSVKTLMMIGEAPTRTIVKKWARGISDSDQLGQLHLINAYGPAENTLFSTMYSFKSCNDDPTNIGTGVNTLTWIVDPLDPNLLLPVGCVGELILQGTQLAREYLYQPDETSKNFIRAPKWARNMDVNRSCEAFGNIFYKTGDLVRYESDGTLRFIGRVDSQTKLNGQRFELDEVEYHVSQLLIGFHTVASIVEPYGGPRCLAVFIEVLESPLPYSPSLSSSSLSSSPSPTPPSCLSSFPSSIPENNESVVRVAVTSRLKKQLAHCRAKLQECLPSFMVPALFVPINGLPQSPSNKLDRKALQGLLSDVTFEQLHTTTNFSSDGALPPKKKEPPQTHAQITLQKLWSKVLGVSISNIGLGDNFFAMGGDSIRAIRLAALMSAENSQHVRISSSIVWQKPVLRNMATILELNKNEVQRTAEDLIQPPLLPDLELIDITLEEREEVLQYCASSLGLTVESIQDIYPCTPTQESMIAASAVSPNAYMMEQEWALSSSTNLVMLEDAWRRTIHEFDILRTSFVSTSSLRTLQIVSRPVKSSVVFQHSNAVSNDDKSLSALTLVEGKKGEHTLIWRVHHALFDQWTLVMVNEAVERAYVGKEIDKPVQFKSFIKYLTGIRSNNHAVEHDAYWNDYLKGTIPTRFPLRSRSVAAPRKKHARITLPTSIQSAHSVTAAIVARAAWALVLSQYTNTDTVVFGATLGGRNEVLPEIESICGPTITTLPIKVHMPKDQSISSFLQMLQDEAVLMMPHEHHDIQRIRKLSKEIYEACDLQNLLVIQPIWEEEGEAQRQAVMQPIADESTTSEYHTIPLALGYSLNGANSMLEAQFDEDAISRVQITRVLRQIEHVAHQLQSLDAESDLGDIEFVCGSDRNEIDRWNKKDPELVDDFIDKVIARQAVLRPNAEAICSHDGSLTYSQFEDLSQRLAEILILDYGISSGDIVPLCFEKSLWAMVAMLGVLKSGAAFAPTDPAQSPGRLREIVHQALPKVILVSETTSVIDFSTNAAYLILNKKMFDMAPAAATAREMTESATYKNDRLRSTSDLAYIIFTSGTTGKPKGVMIQHNAYLTGARPRGVALARSETARVIQFATYSFDTSIEDTLTTWGYGACVCIPSEWERLNDLEGVMNRLRVSCMHLTASLAAALTPANVPTLRQMHFGGEKLTASALQIWAKEGSGIDVRNIYGPTETSISNSVTSRLSPHADPSNIGFAVGCKYWVVDLQDHNCLMPIGCSGELLIEGHLLAKGYLNNPEKTAESFIVDPKWAIDSRTNRDSKRIARRRFYKTGDVVKYADDGSMICLGRKDTQVKLNGYRIEIGDVETNLRNILDRAVDDLAIEVVVPKKNNTHSTPLLVGFISIGSRLHFGHSQSVGAEGNADIPSLLDSREAQTTLTAILAGNNTIKKMQAIVPSYMVPTAFVPLHEIPRTIAKKTDRSALQQLVGHMDAHELRSFVDLDSSSSTETAETTSQGKKLIRELCATVLSQEENTIKASDSFIQLGGDSISALRFVAAARRRGFDALTVANTLFARSLNDLAKFYQHDDGVLQDNEVKTSISSNVKRSLVEGVAQQMHILPEEIEAVGLATGFQHLAFEACLLPERGYMTSFFFNFSKPLYLHRLEHACERLIARHGALRTVFMKHDGKLCQVVLRHRLSDEPRLQFLTESKLDVDIVRGCVVDAVPETGYNKPLIQFSVSQGESATQFVICLSHGLYDGISWRTICDDLSDAYLGVPLGDPATQFYNFRAELINRTGSDAQLFWKRLLQGSKLTDLLAATTSTTTTTTDDNARYSYGNVEDSEVSSTMYCPGNGSILGFTFASFLNAAWALVLARHSSTNDVAFVQVVTTRGLVYSSTEDLIGPALEFIPVRVDVNEENNIGCASGVVKEKFQAARAQKLLEIVQGQHIEGMPHHAYGFPNIVNECTEWPSSTRMHSLVQHQTLEEKFPELLFQDGLAARAQEHNRRFGMCDLLVVTTSLGAGEVRASIKYSGKAMKQDMVRMLLHELVAELYRLRLSFGTLESASV